VVDEPEGEVRPEVLNPTQMLALRFLLEDQEMISKIISNSLEIDPEKQVKFWNEFAQALGETQRICTHCHTRRMEHIKGKCLFEPTMFEAKSDADVMDAYVKELRKNIAPNQWVAQPSKPATLSADAWVKRFK
jgi:hypothetical protein